LIYLALRLSFVYYAIIIENQSAIDAISRTWNLTKGFWWQISWAFFLIVLVVGLPAGILVAIFRSGNPLIYQFVPNLISLFISPIISTYYVFLFMSLVNISSKNNRRNTGHI